MGQKSIVLSTILLVQLCTVAGLAQQDRLQGRWEGTTRSFQGEMATTAIFNKEAAGYIGTISGRQGPIAFKEIVVDGDNVTANAEVDSPQGG